VLSEGIIDRFESNTTVEYLTSTVFCARPAPDVRQHGATLLHCSYASAAAAAAAAGDAAAAMVTKRAPRPLNDAVTHHSSD